MKKTNNALIPKLRFPEFKKDGEWEYEPLKNYASRIDEKVGNRTYQSMSITSGVGLVSQVEKFGREISGSSYKNYIVIRKHDFAFNKSATKAYPQGFIALLKDIEVACVPNSIFTCFTVNKALIDPEFLDFIFFNNYHGIYLKKFIEVGARAHGSLSINDSDLFEMPIPHPEQTEQQKIADCLSSLDELISASKQKLEALQQHKKALLQNLFPAPGQTLPKWRFKGFKGGWEEKLFSEVFTIKGSNTFSREYMNSTGGSVKNIHYGDIHTKYQTILNVGSSVIPFINSDVNLDKIKPENYCKDGDMIFADASEDIQDIGKCIEIQNLRSDKILSGLHTILARPTNQLFSSGFCGYLFNSESIKRQIQRESQGTKVLGLSGNRLNSISIQFPQSKSEQQKIADCLSSADALITARQQQIEMLQLHKKGLMQGLFPSI